MLCSLHLQECPQLFEDSSSTSSNSSGAFGAAGSCTAGWSPYSYEEEAAAQEAAVAAAADVPAPATSVYEVGRTLLFFHSLGWSHISVMRRIVGLYPQVSTIQLWVLVCGMGGPGRGRGAARGGGEH
jgi:hypothetical protein